MYVLLYSCYIAISLLVSICVTATICVTVLVQVSMSEEDMCRWLPSGNCGIELKTIDQSMLGRDTRLIKNDVDDKNRAIMETRLKKLL